MHGHRHTHIVIILLSALVGASVTFLVLYGRGTSRPMSTVSAQDTATDVRLYEEIYRDFLTRKGEI